MDNSHKQGSTEWLALRKSKITSTDAAIILEISPYCTPFTLWQRKLGLIPEQEQNEAMRKGQELEPLARDAFIDETKIYVEPAVLFHKEHNWAMASLDGLSKCLKIAVEIKCSKKIYENALNNEIDPIYYAQCQHHISVADIEMIYFFAYWEGKSKTIVVLRDQNFIDDLMQKELLFYEKLVSFTAPELGDKDYNQRCDISWITKAEITMESQKKASYWKKKYDMDKDELEAMSNQQSCIGGGYRLTKSIRPGNCDYSLIPELQNVDINKYRKSAIESYRLSEV